MMIEKVVQKTKMTLIFVFFILIAGNFANASNIIDLLQTIPKEHQTEIKKLFEDLFKYQAFAYSLYGEKPMTLSDSITAELSSDATSKFLPIDKYCLDVLEIYSEPSEIFKNRWDIWNKYKNLFKIKNYIFTEKIIGKCKRLFIINKRCFKDTINQNINLFKTLIDSNLSSENLLAQFENEKTNVFDILQHNEGLLGILLGFGEYNAMLFQKREYLFDKLEIAKRSGIYKLDSIQNRIKFLNTKLQLLREHDSYIIASINRVCFVADAENYETIKYKADYDKLNKKINEIYSKDDWFEQTLIQLTNTK